MQVGFRDLVQSIGRRMKGETLMERIFKTFPRAQLFSQEILGLPFAYMELKEVLDCHGVLLPQHSSRRIVQAIAHGLYSDSKQCESETQTALFIFIYGRRVCLELR